MIVRPFLLLLPLLALAACEPAPQEPQPTYEAASYEYLPKIKLDVRTIDIDDNWVPRGSQRHIEALSPVQPRDALRAMAADRLITGGTKGRAAFTITDASLVQAGGNVTAHFAVRVDLFDDSNAKLGQMAAEVTRVAPLPDDSPEQTRIALYRLVGKAMEDMNVELQYQLQRTMKTLLQNTSTSAPEAGPVQVEDLNGAKTGDPNPSGVLKAPPGATP
jgi:hypothetical protein